MYLRDMWITFLHFWVVEIILKQIGSSLTFVFLGSFRDKEFLFMEGKGHEKQHCVLRNRRAVSDDRGEEDVGQRAHHQPPYWRHPRQDRRVDRVPGHLVWGSCEAPIPYLKSLRLLSYYQEKEHWRLFLFAFFMTPTQPPPY